MKTTAMLLAAATTAGAIGAWVVRGKCETVALTNATNATHTTNATYAAASVPVPVIESFALPETLGPRRDVFAFPGSVSRPPEKRAGVIVPVAEIPQVIVEPPPPKREEPAYQYLGSFGPQTKPILVYKGNGDVVNVALGKP